MIMKGLFKYKKRQLAKSEISPIALIFLIADFCFYYRLLPKPIAFSTFFNIFEATVFAFSAPRSK